MLKPQPKDLPEIAQYKPYYKELEANKTYLWCACGLSKNQPYCDGSHVDTGFLPVRYKPQEYEEVLFCGCKRTADAPFCDGTHNNLKDEYDTDDPNSPENKAIPEVESGNDGRTWLNGGCFVASVEKLEKQTQGNLIWATVLTEEQGAKYQSMFLLEIDAGQTPVIQFGQRDVILLLTHGQGTINISSRSFNIESVNGVYVRPGEQFSLNNTGSEKLVIIASVCPMAIAPVFDDEMGSNFNDESGQRTIGLDPAKQEPMADRFFQMLVDKNMGSSSVAQFIGDIPLSKAAPHRHLYEESLVILRGSGCMWTENRKTRVNAGDVIFLPRKQLHSLECTDPDHMLLAGVIYPGGNPSINY
jgi:CDGSH-type Zn-finger protein/mannose-6-phosphate isomerase-like protein (cupin superfamily)